MSHSKTTKSNRKLNPIPTRANRNDHFRQKLLYSNKNDKIYDKNKIPLYTCGVNCPFLYVFFSYF